jgi:type I restriction enzyme S subunit
MTLKTFFEKFDLFADAPNAVEQMRELVLQLAVTGKLDTQNERDEPASILLETTETERANLVAAKRIRSRPTAPIELDEQPYELPSSWAWTRLSNVGYELGQKVPNKSFTYIDVGGIDADKGRISDRVEKLEPGNAPSRARKLVARGTVIYSTVRPYLLNIAIVDQDFDPEPIASTAFGILHPFSGINNRYLFYWLRSAPFTEYVQAGMKGMAYPAINDEKFYSGPIPLPPLAEQKRIVAKVDELMVLCDRLEAQQQERQTRHAALARASLARFADAPTPANLHFLFHKSYTIPPADLRKSILTLAVQGKLVPQDPNDEEPEVALLELHRARTRQAKAGKLRAAKVPANTFLEEPIPFIPDSWRTVSFDHVAVAHNNALKAGPFGSALKKEFYVEKGYKIYGQEQVIAGDPFIGDYYIDKKKFSELESCAVSTGDILISLVGTIGKILVMPDGIEPGIINPRVIKLSLDASLVYPIFIKVLIGSPYAVDFFEENSHGGTMNILNLSILRALPLPLPPLAEQRRIVAKVEQLMALVDELETQLAASRATAKNLLEALVVELTAAEPQLAVAS